MQRGGRGGGGFRGGGRSFGGGGRGGGGRSFGGGRGGGRGFQDYGPPSEVTEAGIFEHPCEGEAVCKLSIDKVDSRLPVLTAVVGNSSDTLYKGRRVPRCATNHD